MFPKECKYCGITRKSSKDRPCLNMSGSLSDKEMEKIDENCPAAIVMYV